MKLLTYVVPWPYRIAILVVLSTALFCTGWIKGAASASAKLSEFKQTVILAGKKQEAKNKEVEKSGKKITNNVGKDYDKSNFDIHRIYGPGRLLHANPGSSSAAAISNTTEKSDGRSSDSGLGTGIRPPQKDECQALKSDAAATTVQLLFLRDWIEQQKEEWESVFKSTQDGTEK